MTKEYKVAEISIKDAVSILSPAVNAAKEKHDYQTTLAALLVAAGAFAEDLCVLPEEQARFSVEMRKLAIRMGS